MHNQLKLPELHADTVWSIYVVDTSNGDVLLEHQAHQQLETASIGKIFLLIEVARRIVAGELDPRTSITIPAQYQVADSGILYRMQKQDLCIADLALLVGAVSDNLATNGLIHHLGLENVRAVATKLGYKDTSLHDYLRDERRSDMPWTPSYGTAFELADVMRRLAAGTIYSPQVSDQVLSWLGSNTDTSMSADAFVLDPLAHLSADYQQFLLRNKTGSNEFVRVDVGVVSAPQAEVAYAIGVNWKYADADMRSIARGVMRNIGDQIRARVTAHPFHQ